MKKEIEWEEISQLEDDEMFSGIIPQINAHIGHTNWPIPKENVLKILDTIDGIEACKIPSKYRIVILCGALFDWNDIKIKIENILGCHEIEQESYNLQTAEYILNKSEEFNKIYDYWSAYIFPNGKLMLKHSSSIEDIKSKTVELLEFKSQSGGIILIQNKVEAELNGT